MATKAAAKVTVHAIVQDQLENDSSI